ncbi:MAG: hypothetical protein QM664_14150 [Flavihumibacter sp.]
MKRNHIAIILNPALLFAACSHQQQPVTQPEGKVKLESISVTSKIAGRIEKYVQEDSRFIKATRWRL